MQQPNALHNNFEIATLLLKHGALVHVDEKNNNGITPLYITDNMDIAKLLLEHGTNWKYIK